VVLVSDKRFAGHNWADSPVQESGHTPRDRLKASRYDSDHDEPGCTRNRAQYLALEGANTAPMPVSRARCETECGLDAESGQKRYN